MPGASSGVPGSAGPAWRHSAADVSGVESAVLEDVARVVQAIRHALAGFSMHAEVHVHRFEPSGASLVAAGPTVRVVLHTWPELGTVTIDVHSGLVDPSALVERCLRALVGTVAAEVAIPDTVFAPR